MIIHSLHFIHLVICFFIKRILFNYSSQIIVKHTPIRIANSAERRKKIKGVQRTYYPLNSSKHYLLIYDFFPVLDKHSLRGCLRQAAALQVEEGNRLIGNFCRQTDCIVNNFLICQCIKFGVFCQNSTV